MRSLYDPSTYPQGVANPYGARVHAWNEEGPAEYGTRYHGGVWTQPMPADPWQPRPIAGVGCLGCADVNTRGGVFGEQRFGGGVFSGLGAGPDGLGEINWWCWDAPGFKECHAETLRAAQQACAAPRWGEAGYLDYDDCVVALTDEFVGERCACSPSAPGTETYTPEQGIAIMQRLTNVWLLDNGYCPIAEDGKLGKKTCGAAKETGATPPPECNAIGFTKPSKQPCAGSPGGHPVSPSVVGVQQLVNEWLRANGYCEIAEDGVLGPATCGGLRASGNYVLGDCASVGFADPRRPPCVAEAPVGPIPPTPRVCPMATVLVGDQCVPIPPTPEPKKGGTMTAWLVGGLLAAAVVGGVVYAVQQDKKKQKKAA